ncbi:MAG: efflux RND transporter periplasmic adaptor subunit [Deltaproteobacteria bacterium]|nr:efflux RND transporter periplasmic adaptor subunit [Deltaproteobacteria bacterium]
MKSAAMALIIGLAGIHAGCRKGSSAIPEAAASAPSASASAPSEGHQVKIDPDLVSSGRITVKPAERRALADETLASGEVTPAVDGEAQVGALVSGRVMAILVKEGDRVKAGQVLAWIDAPDAARMQGDWLRSRARLWRADKMVEQERKLWAEKATSERALQAAEAELRESQAAERSAHSLLVASHVPVPSEGGKAGAARIAVTSPISGVVSHRGVMLGGHVTADMSLFEIVAPEKLILKANVPEVLARRVEVGGPAIIRLRGTDSTCNGTVQTRLDRIEEQRRTMTVLVSFAPGCTGLVAGGFADVTVRLSASGTPPLIVVPRTSIVEFDGAPAVFVHAPSRGPGDFDIHVVRLGHTDGVHTVVEDGLKEGEPVVVGGALLLKGEHIRKDLGG